MHTHENDDNIVREEDNEDLDEMDDYDEEDD